MCKEEGWGEFDMTIVLHAEKGQEHSITHDLNFQKERYETKHTLVSGQNAVRHDGNVC
jgi:transcription initiation factor IIF auxiliary subunit